MSTYASILAGKIPRKVILIALPPMGSALHKAWSRIDSLKDYILSVQPKPSSFFLF